MTPARNLTDGRLLVVGGDVYMAAIVPALSNVVGGLNNTFSIVLLKKTP